MTGPARDGAWLADFGERLARAGFLVAGGFRPGPDDDVPALPDGAPAATVLVVGSLSNTLLPILKERAEWRDGVPDPLDRYTRAALTALADDARLGVVFPFDGPPYYPFQRWALRTGGFSRSPMGVLADEPHGPWLGLRAAFLAREVLPVTGGGRDGPCPTCADTPCISACPAGALSSSGYDVPRCLSWLAANPSADCHRGCLARRACPFGRDHAQGYDEAAFHMRSFLDAAF
jgi:hypothetical protein